MHSDLYANFFVKTWPVCLDLYKEIRRTKYLKWLISMMGSCVNFSTAIEMAWDPLASFSAVVKELSFMDLHHCTSFQAHNNLT